MLHFITRKYWFFYYLEHIPPTLLYCITSGALLLLFCIWYFLIQPYSSGLYDSYARKLQQQQQKNTECAQQQIHHQQLLDQCAQTETHIKNFNQDSSFDATTLMIFNLLKKHALFLDSYNPVTKNNKKGIAHQQASLSIKGTFNNIFSFLHDLLTSAHLSFLSCSLANGDQNTMIATISLAYKEVPS